MKIQFEGVVFVLEILRWMRSYIKYHPAITCSMVIALETGSIPTPHVHSADAQSSIMPPKTATKSRQWFLNQPPWPTWVRAYKEFLQNIVWSSYLTKGHHLVQVWTTSHIQIKNLLLLMFLIHDSWICMKVILLEG